MRPAGSLLACWECNVTEAVETESPIAVDVQTLPEVLEQLDAVAPNAPLIALGQTPLWDEPLKAIIAAGATRPMLIGIHDLDYFSRLRAPRPGPAWQIVPRNDGALREVWIAAGELSALFGAEVWPSRQELADAGLHLDRLLPKERRPEMFDRVTEAWGWRGIVQNAAQPSVICDVRARDVAPALIELLHWGSRCTQGLLVEPAARRHVRTLIAGLAGEIESFLAEEPEGSLCALYGRLLRGMYERLIGALPGQVHVTGAREIFRFNRRTAGAGRFRFLGHFLAPRTADVCRAAYDEAVADSSMTRLADSGDGALPFEIYLPGRGRGMLHVTPRALRIDLPEPMQWPINRPVQSVQELAAALEARVGPEAALLGKALALPAMLSGEFVIIFHESGSVYTPRTQRMLAAMRRDGVPVRVHPLLRVRLRTWDALAHVPVSLRLPEHLAQAFGEPVVAASEWSRRWRQAVKEQKRLLGQLKGITNPCDLAQYLGHEEHERWFRRMDQCAQATAALLAIQQKADALRHKSMHLRAKIDEALAEIRNIESRRGELNRTRIRPLMRRLADGPGDAPAPERQRLQVEHAEAQKRGRALLLALELKQKERRRLQERRAQLVRQLGALERGGRAAAARRVLRLVEREAARARLRLARNAILASQGLPHADLRPAAWWLPALDPSGQWFEQVRRTARFRLEPLIEE